MILNKKESLNAKALLRIDGVRVIQGGIQATSSLYEDILRNRVWIRRRRCSAGVNKHNQVGLMWFDCDLKEQTILQIYCDWIIIIPIWGIIVTCLEHIHCKGKVAISTFSRSNIILPCFEAWISHYCLSSETAIERNWHVLLPGNDGSRRKLDASHFVVKRDCVFAFVMRGSTVVQACAQGNVGIIVRCTAWRVKKSQCIRIKSFKRFPLQGDRHGVIRTPHIDSRFMTGFVVNAHRCTFATFAIMRPRSVGTLVGATAILSFTFVDILARLSVRL